ncbi:hypothetical protein GCM10010096_26910 [Alcaligenes pakistanensis]|uniref:DUF4440 domain-containing protein n=1 Tax=Alcaligenes pakistanensis TaxID=1482717 RepID=A0A8H9IJ25_9BURK|nr:nuclear transport factor 2 family protein [Alcaligenes pakistanensis]GHC53240.1 hypothetical protein GCM10010096_26910 [Alcaligenes pakistanensis]
MRDQAELQLAIQAAEDKLALALSSRDVATLLKRYTDEIHLMPHGVPTLVGKVAVGAYFEEVFRMGVCGAQFETLTVEGEGDEAREVGRYTLYAGASQAARVVAQQGRYLVIWRKVAGEWLLHWDMFNAEQAEA